MNPLVEQVQRRVLAAGFNPGTIDGLPGIKTRGAISAYEAKHGLAPDGIIDPLLLKSLGIDQPTGPIDPPWLAILRSKQGLREKEDYAALAAWLKSDKRTLGDPRKLPWCGDAIETCILNAGFGPVPSNPYYARNWADYGRHEDLFFGGIAPFWRGKKTGSDGHVGILIGISAERKSLRVKGGNQKNMICDVWISIDRLIDCRVPITWKGALQPLPMLANDGEPISTNEA